MDKKRIKELEYHSSMLGQIGNIVEDFAIADEMTTVDAVRLVLADLKKCQGELERIEIERKYGQRTAL